MLAPLASSPTDLSGVWHTLTLFVVFFAIIYPPVAILGYYGIKGLKQTSDAGGKGCLFFFLFLAFTAMFFAVIGIIASR